MDLLRFHKFTIGHAWCSDYGNPDEKIHLENNLKLSPLHNIRIPKVIIMESWFWLIDWLIDPI